MTKWDKNKSSAKSCWLLWLAIMTSCSCLVAQEPSMIRYGVEDGLPSSKVYCAIQDDRGYMWFGTDKGLSRFDGYEFKNYTVGDGLPSNEVFGLNEDSEGRVWISTFNNLCYVYEDSITKLSNFPRLEGKIIIHKIFPTFSNLIGHFVSFGNSDFLEFAALFFDSTNSFHVLPIALPSEADSNFNFISLKLKDGFRIAESTGVMSHLDDRKIIARFNDAGQLISSDTFGIPEYFLPIAVDSFSPFNFQEGNSKAMLTFNNIMAKYAINLNSQLIRRLGFGHKFPSLSGFEEWVRNSRLNFVFLTKNNQAWICTNTGLFLLNSFENDCYPIKLNNISNHQGVLKPVNSNVKIQANEVSRGIFKILDDLYGLMQDELFFFMDTDRINKLKEVSISGLKNIRWLNDSSCIVSFANGIKIFSFTIEGDLKDVKSIPTVGRNYAAEKLNSQLVVGKADGLFILKNSILEPHPFSFKMGNPFVVDLAIDSKERLWVATGVNGIYVIHHNTLTHIKETKGNILKQIHLDEAETVWGATNDGVVRIEFPDDSSESQYKFRRISINKGLATSEMESVYYFNSTLFAYGKNSISILKKKLLNPDSTIPNVVISKVFISDEMQKIESKYRLSAFQRKLSVNFICLDYKSLGNITYEYRMIGLDSSWTATKERSVTYPYLPSGDFTFQVRARNVDGVLTKKTASIDLSVAYPFYMQWPYWIMGGSILLALLWGGYKIRINQIRKRAEVDNEIQRQVARLELKALQAQMNPHFVFNAMNAIQDFILDEEPASANAFLVRFSRLVRMTLDASNKRHIDLWDEIEMLELYVGLEQARFGGAFSFHLEVDPQLKKDSVDIPALIVQPFVENAILHGLAPKKEPGNLWLSFNVQGGQLKIVIQDDGVGRAASATAKRHNKWIHESRGLSLIEERVNLLNEYRQQAISFQIHDLKDEYGHAAGTTVSISIELPKGER